MGEHAKHITDLKAKWVGQRTPDNLSGVIYVGSQSVCVIGNKTPEITNEVLDHILALRDVAAASAKYRTAIATYDLLHDCETPRDDDAVSRAATEVSVASVELDHALRAAGDPCALRRQARDVMSDDADAAHPGHYNADEYEEVEVA